MKYYFEKTLNTDFETTVETTIEALKSEGFGVLSEIDIHDKLKEKLDVDFRRYKILGACNPQFAYEALQEEDKIGIMLPCNVIIQEFGNNKVQVAAVDPVASMMAIDNPKLTGIAGIIQEKLKRVIDKLK
ncbi:DUF302 domain-containing protein [Labilibaculum sp. K2S]|uniref:DUF302 domain-containing protein n=1 Tax=Labilibaculum sp. K2S TaxID=3056386 RepID=UPI0025A4AC4A|nr:DUF302 domain-containing protein [Labilibaculum sp. K2S]MDM8159594.1 DUF302 domain-containing protein [Labilibaculum sp. K2S]